MSCHEASKLRAGACTVTLLSPVQPMAFVRGVLADESQGFHLYTCASDLATCSFTVTPVLDSLHVVSLSGFPLSARSPFMANPSEWCTSAGGTAQASSQAIATDVSKAVANALAKAFAAVSGSNSNSGAGASSGPSAGK